MNNKDMVNYPFKFSKISGRLIRRINRFVVEVEVEGCKEEAYLANPGRLWELFLPGTELLLSSDLSRGKMPYTVLACLKEGRQILLHTHLTNQVIRNLIDNHRLTLFKDYKVVRGEPACGRVRLDLLLKHHSTGADYYLEVKSCTLFAGRVAMFPDAVTKRGADHLCKLKELSNAGVKTGCLFVVMDPGTDYFLPAYHIDSSFASVFREVQDQVQLNAVALGFDPAFSEVETIKPLQIPFGFLDSELQDRGVYLLLIRIEDEKTIAVGGLGQKGFERGYYVYVGSAKRGLSKRVARHTRKRKRKRWHVDYLVAEADKVAPVSIMSSDQLECKLAESLQNIADHFVKGFGSSDCRCESHLYYFAENPLQNLLFIEMIQYYRIMRLERKLIHNNSLKKDG